MSDFLRLPATLFDVLFAALIGIGVGLLIPLWIADLRKH